VRLAVVRLAIVVLACVACKMPVAHLPVGTRVPMDELQRHRSELARFIAGELAAGNHARAFYALELEKTRPYSQQALAARDRASDRIATTDLRPVFLAFADTESGSHERGLALVASSRVAAERDGDDVAFWKHMRLFEQRTSPLNETTGGIPYDYASRVAFGVSTAEEVGRLFGPGEALISYFAHGDTVTAFVIVRGELHVRRIEAAASEIAARLERFLATLRAAPKPGTEGAWQVEARALHGALLAPVMPLLGERIDALFVSPHGFLANVPFSLLVDTRGQPVLETARVTYVPSASIYRQLLSRPILNRAPRLLAVGNAIYPDGIESLDFAELEAVTVAELFPGGRLLRGSAATEARVTDLAPRYNILHFATHGVLLGKVVPGASSLLVTADDTHDGFLSAAEIARLDLSSSYIAVLSACETSVSESTGRSTDLGTLTNAFLSAGAPSVLGTLWQVDDATTTRLMLDFYQQFLVVGAGEALRRAQLALRAEPAFAHPYYWGAFVLFGWDK
jgi:CHAT domain-containing protein